MIWNYIRLKLENLYLSFIIVIYYFCNVELVCLVVFEDNIYCFRGYCIK